MKSKFLSIFAIISTLTACSNGITPPPMERPGGTGNEANSENTQKTAENSESVDEENKVKPLIGWNFETEGGGQLSYTLRVNKKKTNDDKETNVITLNVKSSNFKDINQEFVIEEIALRDRILSVLSGTVKVTGTAPAPNTQNGPLLGSWTYVQLVNSANETSEKLTSPITADTNDDSLFDSIRELILAALETGSQPSTAADCKTITSDEIDGLWVSETVNGTLTQVTNTTLKLISSADGVSEFLGKDEITTSGCFNTESKVNEYTLKFDSAACTMTQTEKVLIDGEKKVTQFTISKIVRNGSDLNLTLKSEEGVERVYTKMPLQGNN